MKKHLIPLMALLILILSSCHDIETKTLDEANAQTLLTESITAYDIFSATQEESTQRGLQLETTKSAQISAEEYPQISVEPADLTTWPKTITVDYGPENITGIDGRQRRGVMIIVAGNFPNVNNASWEVSFDEFYLNDYLVEGMQTVKYTGANNSGNPEYDCTVTDGRITPPEGKSFLFEQHTIREWTGGHDTPLSICDDDYEITGEHSGVSSDGYSYTMTATEPLLLNVCCRYIEDGILSVQLPDAELSCEIDYRPGYDTGDLCNNLASFNIFGNTIPIQL